MCTTCNCYAKSSKIAVESECDLKKKCPTLGLQASINAGRKRALFLLSKIELAAC